jgi:hypothetical protein
MAKYRAAPTMRSVDSAVVTIASCTCTTAAPFRVSPKQNISCIADKSVSRTVSVTHLYAVRDVTLELHQLSVAIGQSAIAATTIHNSLERRLEAGRPIERVASVASFFLSRIDVLSTACSDNGSCRTSRLGIPIRAGFSGR